MRDSSRYCLQFALVVAVICLLIPQNSYALQPEPERNDTLRIGLVLSGGGAKGIAHIGVLKKLEEAGVRIDYISGTSMGALLGALYSIGYTPDQLLEIGRSNNWIDLFTDAPGRRYISNYHKQFDQRSIVSFPVWDRGLELPAGIITGQNIYTFLSDLTWPVAGIESFDDFPIPYSATATDLETGKAVHFRSGYLPDAIRASISIPSVMTPHVINGTSYIDGGVSNNLPVDQALKMGANYIIAVNVASPLMPRDSLKTLSSILNQTVNYMINERIDEQLEHVDLYITPDEVNNYTWIDFDKVDGLVMAGKREAEQYMDRFKELAAKQNLPPNYRPGVSNHRALTFNGLYIHGNERISEQVIRNTLQITPGTGLTHYTIKGRIEKLLSTQLFDLVTYRVVRNEKNQYELHIFVEESEKDNIRLGIRYETNSQASILVSAEYRNLIHNGSLTNFDVRLGERLHFLWDHVVFGSTGSKLAWRTSMLYETEGIDVYDREGRIARFTNNLVRLEFSAGNYLASRSLIALGVRKDFSHFNNTINEEFIRQSDADHHSIFGIFRIDRFNRKAFPNEGHRLVLDGTLSDDFIFSPIDFVSTSGLWEAYYSLPAGLTFRHMIYSGYSSGENLPWNYWFSMNRYSRTIGYTRFGGAKRNELTSRNLQTGSIGIRIEPFYKRFAGLDFYAGRFQNNWNLLNFSLDQIEYGVSLSVGALTIFGPIEAIISTGSLNKFMGEIQIGFQF